MDTSKKICASVMAFATAVAALTSMPISANDEAVKYEFEDGTITGTSTTVMTDEKGYSGTGYVYMKDAGDKISVEVEVPETDMYEIYVCYNLPSSSGSKIQNILINDVNQGQAGFTPNDAFTEMSIGSFKLDKGKNTITIESSWGWTMFDYLRVQQVVLPELSASKATCDKNATESTRRLMSYLADTYGNNIISGQQELYGQAGETEFEYIKDKTGKYPAIRGFDYMNWSQGVNWDDGTNKRIINWVNERKGIATVSWHWFVPLDMSTYDPNKISYENVAFYCNGAGKGKDTTFSPAQAVIKGTPENEFIMKDIDMIAKAIKELQDNDIPIIFRPLHEAEGSSSLDGSGCWFWWASDGAETYKELWKLLYTTLTEDYGLHNIIWEWNSYTYETSSAWYPGDEYVDIIAYDKYNANGQPNESAISGTFYSLVNMYNGKKMVAMAENDTIPNVENLTSEKAGWLYFCPWYAEYITDSKNNNPDTLKSIYNSDYVITLDELPDLKTYPLGDKEPDVTETQPVESETVNTTESTTSEIIDDVRTLKGVILEKSDDTLTVSFDEFDIDKTIIDIPEDQKDYVANSLEVGDRIIVGFAEKTLNTILWIDLLEKAETTNSDTDKPVLPKPTLLGDVTCDGEVDIRDVTMMNQHIVGIVTLDEQALVNGDVVPNNEVDVKDLGQLKKYIIKLIDKF